jgi:hypothetical protein
MKTLASFQGDDPLISGWAFGQKRLAGTSAIVDGCVGSGHLLLFGTEVNQRAQSQADFKFLFNGLFYGPTREAAQACR